MPSFPYTNKQVCAPVREGKGEDDGGKRESLRNIVILIAFGTRCRHANEARTLLLSPPTPFLPFSRKQASVCDHLQLHEDLCMATELIRSGHLDAAPH